LRLSDKAEAILKSSILIKLIKFAAPAARNLSSIWVIAMPTGSKDVKTPKAKVPAAPSPAPKAAAPKRAGEEALDAAEVKRFKGHSKYHLADPCIQAAALKYRDGSTAEKHRILAQFREDKSCRWITSWESTSVTEKEQTDSSSSGWVNKRPT
jgi:hypothetical protein